MFLSGCRAFEGDGEAAGELMVEMGVAWGDQTDRESNKIFSGVSESPSGRVRLQMIMRFGVGRPQ